MTEAEGFYEDDEPVADLERAFHGGQRGLTRSPGTARFETFTDSRGQFHFRLIAANGRVIASSGGFLTRAEAIRAIEELRRAAPNAELAEAVS